MASGLHYSLTQMPQLPAASDMRLVLLLLWVAGVATLGAVALLLRGCMRLAGLSP